MCFAIATSSPDWDWTGTGTGTGALAPQRVLQQPGTGGLKGHGCSAFIGTRSLAPRGVVASDGSVDGGGGWEKRRAQVLIAADHWTAAVARIRPLPKLPARYRYLCRWPWSAFRLSALDSRDMGRPRVFHYPWPAGVHRIPSGCHHPAVDAVACRSQGPAARQIGAASAISEPGSSGRLIWHQEKEIHKQMALHTRTRPDDFVTDPMATPPLPSRRRGRYTLLAAACEPQPAATETDRLAGKRYPEGPPAMYFVLPNRKPSIAAFCMGPRSSNVMGSGPSHFSILTRLVSSSMNTYSYALVCLI